MECTLGNLGAGSIIGEPRVEPRVLSLYKHGGLGGCGVRIPVLVQYVSCQVEGVAARGKMGVAVAAKEGLLPRATAHVLRRRRERFR